MMRPIAAVLCLALLATNALAQEAREIRFAPGHNSATVSGAVVRGTRDFYTFSARKGQVASIDISALESNAAISVWRPGARIGSAVDEDIQGRTLPGADDGQDAVRWKGSLPESGRYLIVVGPMRGNATYELRLGIGARPGKPPAGGSSQAGK